MARIVGRDGELGAVEAFLSAHEPASTGLAIVGEPGIGKTSLWEEGVRLARDSGASVLVARPTESEARLSFAGLADLLAAVPAAVEATLPAPQRRALDVALLRVEAGQAPERRVLGTAVASLIRQLATEGEVAVAVDDVQWLDAPSAAVVEFALRRVRDLPVRVLVSLRSQAGSAVLGAVPDERLRRIDLGPLSVAALHQIVADRLGRRFSRPTMVRIAEAAAGNALYALEIARLVDGGHGSAPLPVPPDVLALVRDRIRSLPAESRDALLRAAAAARPELSLVDAGALAPAEEAGLVAVGRDGRIVFAHPLYASAVYSSAAVARRREAHSVLADTVSDAEERARHLALATNGRDEQVAGIVEDAASLAHARGAPDAAAELMELALTLTPPTAGAVDLRRLELARYLELAGGFERAAALLGEIIATSSTGDLQAEALLLRSGLVYRSQGESEAAIVARQAMEAARDPVLRARCQAVLAGWIGTVDTAGATAAARAAVDVLERAGDRPAILSFALANLVRAELFGGNGFDEHNARRALSLEVTAAPAAVDDRVVYKLGQWLRYVDDFDGARDRLVESEQAAEDEGDESSLVNILLNRLVLELWAGDWQLAADISERLRHVGRQLGLPHAASVWQTYLDAHLGRRDEVWRAALAADRSEPVVDMLYLRSLGLVELSAERYDDAHAHLREVVDVIERSGIREPAVWRADGEAIEAALAAGDHERAAAHAARFEEQAARSRIPWSIAVSARCRGLVLAAQGDLDGATAALDRALTFHESCPVPFEQARTLLAAGRVRRRRKEKRLAREALESALTLFERLGAELWVARTRDELRRVTTRKAAGTLTATEREIAELAAAGLTNQAIAERVFVSRKTVEANLARAYRKLGISSRVQVARALEESTRAIS